VCSVVKGVCAGGVVGRAGGVCVQCTLKSSVAKCRVAVVRARCRARCGR